MESLFVSACVRWNGVLSHTFKITADVREGGILSPVLFLVYVNDILLKLAKFGQYWSSPCRCNHVC